MNVADYPEAFAALAERCNKMAECIKITRADGTIYRFTAYSEDLSIVEADTFTYKYLRADAFDLTALELTSGLVVSNLDMKCLITDDSITESDLLSGLLDDAEVYLFLVVWEKSGAKWELPLRLSWLGEIAQSGLSFQGDIRGVAQRLAQVFVATTSLECRNILGDTKCGVALGPYTITTTVASVNQSYTEVTVNGDLLGLDYTWGRIIFNDGQAANIDMEITDQTGNTVTLFLPLYKTVEAGDSVDLILGCSKVYAACITFLNGVRFNGEPYLEGKDIFGRYPNPPSENV
jgi:uncharacterized phage protein (TIGR02218 family)